MAVELSITTASTLRRPDKWGVYVIWPEEGLHNVHPDDLWLAERLLPGNRVFLRRDLNEEFNLLTYGRHQLRVRPTMWVETPEPEFKLGQQVEVRSQMGRLTPQIARVAQIFWNSRQRCMEFELSRVGRSIPGRFLAGDLSAVGQSAGFLSLLGR